MLLAAAPKHLQPPGWCFEGLATGPRRTQQLLAAVLQTLGSQEISVEDKVTQLSPALWTCFSRQRSSLPHHFLLSVAPVFSVQ